MPDPIRISCPHRNLPLDQLRIRCEEAMSEYATKYGSLAKISLTWQEAHIADVRVDLPLFKVTIQATVQLYNDQVIVEIPSPPEGIPETVQSATTAIKDELTQWLAL